jgi:D-sedoheptulose 7-phosphate isomerase
VDALEELRHKSGTVFIAGNGGSSSTASHFAVDWGVGLGISQHPLRTISISESAASITATGNDQSFTRVFARQLECFGSPGDLLVLISASGNSQNLIETAETARSMGIKIASITGFDGGLLKTSSDISIHVETAILDYGVAEDLHLMIGHVIKESLRARA